MGSTSFLRFKRIPYSKVKGRTGGVCEDVERRKKNVSIFFIEFIVVFFALLKAMIFLFHFLYTKKITLPSRDVT